MNDNRLEREINDTVANAISKIEDLEGELEALNDENSGLRDRVEEKQSIIDDLEDTINGLREALEELRREDPFEVDIKIVERNNYEIQ